MGKGAESNGHGARNGLKNGVQGNGASNGAGRTNGASPQKLPVVLKAAGQPKGGQKWTLSSFRQASRRPLPTELGDGSYRVVAKRPGLMQDLRSIGWAGEHGRLDEDEAWG